MRPLTWAKHLLGWDLGNVADSKGNNLHLCSSVRLVPMSDVSGKGVGGTADGGLEEVPQARLNRALSLRLL